MKLSSSITATMMLAGCSRIRTTKADEHHVRHRRVIDSSRWDNDENMELQARRNVRKARLFSHYDHSSHGMKGKGKGKGKGMGKGSNTSEKSRSGGRASEDAGSRRSRSSSGNDLPSPPVAPTLSPPTMSTPPAPTNVGPPPPSPTTSAPTSTSTFNPPPPKGTPAPTSAPTTSAPTFSPTTMLDCPCFDPEDIDKDFEVLGAFCILEQPDSVGLFGDRSSTATEWAAFAGLNDPEAGPVCLFKDSAYNKDIETSISSEELEDCQSILLDSQMFAVNNCTPTTFNPPPPPKGTPAPASAPRSSSAPTTSPSNTVSDPTSAPTFSPTTPGPSSPPTTSTPTSSAPTSSAPSSSPSDTVSGPTSAPMPLLDCPCFNSTDIDAQVEALGGAVCTLQQPDLVGIGLFGARPITQTEWIAFAGLIDPSVPESGIGCSFADSDNGLGNAETENGIIISPDQLDACQSILLESQMFAANANCTQQEFSPPTTSAPTFTSTSAPPASSPSEPTSAPTFSQNSCPCFRSTDIDTQVEALEASECMTNASASVISLAGSRPNATFWVAVAGVLQGSELPPACLFSDPANGLGSASDEPTFNITSDELKACRSILLESQMFKANENCTQLQF